MSDLKEQVQEILDTHTLGYIAGTIERAWFCEKCATHDRTDTGVYYVGWLKQEPAEAAHREHLAEVIAKTLAGAEYVWRNPYVRDPKDF